MNKKVQEFIDKKKDEQKVKEVEERNAHLISLGLIDKEKSTYTDAHLVAIEVTDEEYQEILKYAPVDVKKSTLEKTIKGAGIILVAINIIEIIMMFIDLGECSPGSYAYQNLTENIGVRIAQCLYLPLIFGFAKIVGAAEKYLKRN